MNLFSPTILVGCVGESYAAHDSGGEQERRLASTARGLHGMSFLGRSGGCFGRRISGQHGATAPGKSSGRGASSAVWSLRAACAAGEAWAD